MMHERGQGNYSSVRHDKLIINDRVYKYNDSTQSIVYIGKRKSQASRRYSAPANRDPIDHVQHATDSEDNYEVDRMIPATDH